MTKAQKTAVIEELKDRLADAPFFYLADASGMTVADVTDFRRACFEKGVQMKAVKNTLLKKAMESAGEEKGYEAIYGSLKGATSILFADTANAPAKVLKAFREDNERPLLKAAYIDTDVYVGDDQIKSLSELKSKEDLLGEVVTLLQSPAKNVISALKSGGSTIAGLVKALEERAAE